MVFIAKIFTKKILKLLSIAFFVITLIFYPSILNSELPFLGSSSVEFSVNAQTVQSERIQEDIKVEIAQAPPAPSGSEQSSKEKKEVINFFQMAMGAIAGLVLFIYGVTRLSEGLEDIGTDRMKNLLSKFTTNRFAGVGTGIVATTLLESSSVTIILVIAMVSAGVLTFVQSLGVVLGSNIGTAVGAQIISLDIEQYVPILMFVGLLVLFLGKTGTQKNIGLILLGFGLMFYGLEAIDEAMKPFRNYQPFIDLMQTLGNNPLLGAIVGAIFTIIIQSSSATVAIVITLAGSGLVSLPAGIAIMLGAEVGTCADTLVATIGRGRPALRTGVFHFLFNLISAILGIIFAPLLAQLVLAISGENVGRQIANAQIIFNLIGVTAVILFLPIIARGLERLIPNAPDNKPEKQLKTATNK
ncbi:Na/Pi cotransporter family protein [Tolypothrix campylonemoides VB511288]|nr:Na/Pi cotransporter family protein [Tolypothrix campylonemoides VB511288]